MPVQSKLLELPDVAMCNVMKFLDYQAIHRLRKTCHDLRNFIDDVKADINVRSVQIVVDQDSIFLDFGAKLEDRDHYKTAVQYSSVPEGCSVKKIGGPQRIILNEDYCKMFLQDFKVLVGFWRNQKYEDVMFSFNVKNRNDEGDFLTERIKEILESGSPINLGELYLTGCNNALLMAIFPYFASKSLDFHVGGSLRNGMDMAGISATELWKSVTSVFLSNTTLTIPIERFSHIQMMNIEVETITKEEILAWKQLYFTSPAIHMILIEWSHPIENDRDLISALGPNPNLNDSGSDYSGADHINWFFRSNNAEKLWHIMYSKSSILFGLMEDGMFSEDAVINEDVVVR